MEQEARERFKANSHPKVSFVKERMWFNILEDLRHEVGSSLILMMFKNILMTKKEEEKQKKSWQKDKNEENGEALIFLSNGRWHTGVKLFCIHRSYQLSGVGEVLKKILSCLYIPDCLTCKALPPNMSERIRK